MYLPSRANVLQASLCGKNEYRFPPDFTASLNTLTLNIGAAIAPEGYPHIVSSDVVPNQAADAMAVQWSEPFWSHGTNVLQPCTACLHPLYPM